MQKYKEDPRDSKIDLGVGVYKNAQGVTPVMRAVKAAEQKIWQDQDSKSYVALAGDPVEGLNVRIMAVVALGLIHDPEPRPSRTLVTSHANYPSRTPALTQLYNIQ